MSAVVVEWTHTWLLVDFARHRPHLPNNEPAWLAGFHDFLS